MAGLPLVVLVVLVMVALMAFWRTVVMICIAAILSLMGLGLIDVVTSLGRLR